MALCFDMNLFSNLLLSLFGILVVYSLIIRSLPFGIDARVVLMTFTPHGIVFEALDDDHDPFSRHLIELASFNARPTPRPNQPDLPVVTPRQSRHVTAHAGPTATTDQLPPPAKTMSAHARPTLGTNQPNLATAHVGPTDTTHDPVAKGVGSSADQEATAQDYEVAAVQAGRGPLAGSPNSEVCATIQDRRRSGFKEKCKTLGRKIACGCFGAAIRVADWRGEMGPDVKELEI